MIKYVLHDPDAKDNREYVLVLSDTGLHVYCTLQEATTFDKRRDAANECEGSEEVVEVESIIKYAFAAGYSRPESFFYIRQGVLFACTKDNATLFDSEELARKAAPRSNYEIVPVEVLEIVPDTIKKAEPVSSTRYRIRDASRLGAVKYLLVKDDPDGTPSLYACDPHQATLFDNQAAAERFAARSKSYEVEPVEVLDLVPDTIKEESNMGYIVQIGNTDRFVQLSKGTRYSVPESMATVFAFKEAALRACTDPDDKVMAVRNHNFKSSASRWVIYNPQRNAFFGPATFHYYTDQIDEATWFTTAAEAKSKCLTGEVVRRVSIALDGAA